MVNLQKSQFEPKQVFKFVAYQYDQLQGLVKPTQNRLESLLQKVSVLPSILQGQGIHVSDRSPYSNKEAGVPGQASYEAHSVAPQEKLEDSLVTGKGNSSSKDSSPAP